MTLWLVQMLRNSGIRKTNISEKPSPSIAAGGVSNDNCSHYWIENDGKADMKPDQSKPPYRVPSMDEIRAITPNGYKVVSTFSGCGGSCTGYRMAGFDVVWANEFVPAAQNSYKANAAPDCILDGRDIRNVTANEILKATGLQSGQLDLFDGSPPCQAFSTAGKREKGWGKLKTYEHGAKQMNEDLFFEYIRLLDGLQPKVFIAENVSGLVKGTAKGYFLDILAGLKACGYNVKAKLLDAQWLGVPQQRQRIIFIGVRDDLGFDPVHPLPLGYRYSVRDALPWIAKAESGPTGFGVGSLTADTPAPTVGASMQAPYSAHKVTVVQDSHGQFAVQRNDVDRPCFAIKAGSSSHVNVEWPNNGFRGGTKLDVDMPMVSIQASAGVTGGTGGTVITNGIEKRKFTIAELKRICAFPDDFILTGSYAQQWERLGNSVPPVMMYHIANEIRVNILDKLLCPT